MHEEVRMREGARMHGDQGLVYHANWALDLHATDGSRRRGQAELKCRFPRHRADPLLVEGTIEGQVTLTRADGGPAQTATVQGGRCVLRRLGSRSHLRMEVTLVGLGSEPLLLRAWCEGDARVLPASGQEAGHVILCTQQGTAVATGAVVLHLRIFLERTSRSSVPSQDTLRMQRVLDVR